MAEFATLGVNVGNSLQQLLQCNEITPGASPSYTICKIILTYHPLGLKMTAAPVEMAQSIPREISVPDSPEDEVRDKFLEQWSADEADKTILSVMTQARAYGVASLGLTAVGVAPAEFIDPKDYAKKEIAFNVWDPLNTSGSLVLNQDPNAIDFQKHRGIAVNGQRYHRSRTVTIFNEGPIYIDYTTSAFGFVGRSVFQRALFPLKSFVTTMITDDMVARKAGVLVAMMKQVGSIADSVQTFLFGRKRQLLKDAENDNVLGIAIEEKIESLNLMNLEGPFAAARKHILENIAAAARMPAILLNNETFAEGFGEGTEDAKYVAGYIDGVRREMAPLYTFLDDIVQRRAWNEEFCGHIRRKYATRYADYTPEQMFYEWRNSFKASWPSLLREPESEKIKVDDTRLKAAIAAFQVLEPILDPENKAAAVEWLQACLNENKILFTTPLNIDTDLLAKWTQENADKLEAAGANQEPDAPPPFSGRDASDSDIVPVAARIAAVEKTMRSIAPALVAR